MEAATRSKTASRRSAAGDRELALQLGALMLHCVGGHGSGVLRVIDESGLSFIQMKLVVTLHAGGEAGEADEEAAPATVSDLADSLGISPASASRSVDGLVRRKLATRSEDPDDRRVRRVALTPKGAELAHQIISARLAGLEEFAASLDVDERAKLEAALEALMKREEIAGIYRRNLERSRG